MLRRRHRNTLGHILTFTGLHLLQLGQSRGRRVDIERGGAAITAESVVKTARITVGTMGAHTAKAQAVGAGEAAHHGAGHIVQPEHGQLVGQFQGAVVLHVLGGAAVTHASALEPAAVDTLQAQVGFI